MRSHTVKSSRAGNGMAVRAHPLGVDWFRRTYTFRCTGLGESALYGCPGRSWSGGRGFLQVGPRGICSWGVAKGCNLRLSLVARRQEERDTAADRSVCFCRLGIVLQKIGFRVPRLELCPQSIIPLKGLDRAGWWDIHSYIRCLAFFLVRVIFRLIILRRCRAF